MGGGQQSARLKCASADPVFPHPRLLHLRGGDHKGKLPPKPGEVYQISPSVLLYGHLKDHVHCPDLLLHPQSH